MGITYRHIPQHRLIIEVWDGVITVDQWRTHLQRYLADPALAALDRSLVDVSTADTSLLTDADEAELVAMYVPHASDLAPMRNAVIAAREYEPSVEFGHRLERLNLNLIVFNELTGASAWLRLDPNEVRPILQDLRDALRRDLNV